MYFERQGLDLGFGKPEVSHASIFFQRRKSIVGWVVQESKEGPSNEEDLSDRPAHMDCNTDGDSERKRQHTLSLWCSDSMVKII